MDLVKGEIDGDEKYLREIEEQDSFVVAIGQQ